MLHVNHIDLLNCCTETNSSRVIMFIDWVATHRLSSVSLFASLTNWTWSTRSAWSTRWSSRTGVTTITLQETSKRVGHIRGSIIQPMVGFWYVTTGLSRGCVPNLDSNSTISSRRTIRSWVSLSDDKTTSGVSFHLPPGRTPCWILIPQTRIVSQQAHQQTHYTMHFESTPSPPDCQCLTSLPDSPAGPVRPGGPTGPGGPRSPPVPGAPCFPGSPWNKTRVPNVKVFSPRRLVYILLTGNPYRQDSTSSSSLSTFICSKLIIKESWLK